MKNLFLILIIFSILLTGCYSIPPNIEKEESTQEKMNPDGYIGGLTIKTGAYWYDAGKLPFYNIGTKKTMNYSLEVAIPLSQVFTVSGFYKQLNHKYSELVNYSNPSYMEWNETDKFYGANVTIYFKRLFPNIF